MKPLVKVQIRNAADMSQQERYDIAEWLTEQADQLVELGYDYDKKFTAKYFPPTPMKIGKAYKDKAKLI